MTRAPVETAMYFDFRTYFKVIRLVFTDKPSPKRLLIHSTILSILSGWAFLDAVCMQLDRIFHDNRDTSAKLERVDARLGQLTDRTPLNIVGHSPGDVVFSHFADDAAPELLQDLKDQLDSLTAGIRMKDEG